MAIHINDLQPAHIGFILGLWKERLGGETVYELLRTSAASWCEELKQGEPSPARWLDSLYRDRCDLKLYVSEEGKVRAHVGQESGLSFPDEEIAVGNFVGAVGMMS